MIRKYLKNLVNRFGLIRMIHVILVLGILILIITIIVQLFVPINLQQSDNQANTISESVIPETISSLLDKSKDKKSQTIAYRPGMFKSATGLQDKPLANKTIEKIRDQLKLQCVMEMNGRPVAYINVQGVGLKKCGIGDSINDLFTVLDINKQNKSVDISIVDHKITLQL